MSNLVSEPWPSFVRAEQRRTNTTTNCRLTSRVDTSVRQFSVRLWSHIIYPSTTPKTFRGQSQDCSVHAAEPGVDRHLFEISFHASCSVLSAYEFCLGNQGKNVRTKRYEEMNFVNHGEGSTGTVIFQKDDNGISVAR
jgi:hypothetical protein